MPIRKVNGGYKWGSHGKVYANRKGAEKQAAAAHANGFKGESMSRKDQIKAHLTETKMPAGVIKQKTKMGNMSGKELADHFVKAASNPYYPEHKVDSLSVEVHARKAAWRHGHGPMSGKYWDKAREHVLKHPKVNVHPGHTINEAVNEGKASAHNEYKNVDAWKAEAAKRGYHTQMEPHPIHTWKHFAYDKKGDVRGNFSHRWKVGYLPKDHVAEETISEVSHGEHMEKHHEAIEKLASKLEQHHSLGEHDKVDKLIKKAPSAHLAALAHYNMGYSGTTHPLTTKIEDHLADY